MMEQQNKQSFSTSQDFDAVSIRIASPERVREWSHGEITKPETINYRTQRSEKNGLFDEKIFGPEKDYECFCGKYKGIRYRGIVCDRCSVEITRSIVRRERMGHIELATPVAHIWFLRSVPSRISLLLGLSAADVEKIVYFAGYIVTKVNEDERVRLLKDIDTEYKQKVKSASGAKEQKKLKDLLLATKQEVEGLVPGQIFDENAYHRFSVKYGPLFEAGIGAEAIYDICKNINLEKLRAQLEKDRESMKSIERAKLDRRLSLVKLMADASVKPEWMFLTVLPVIPPGLRPMVALEGGRHATSDLNDLYRRVINRNNRLKKLMDIQAPEVILRNEKRILQEAVDALLDNSIRHGSAAFSAMSPAQARPLKSLADYLKGKQGYFRQNLLGKRVDYSGRSVIVVGPELHFDECGLPKHMALELFRPFVIAELLNRELAFNIRGAGRLIEEGTPEVWAILEHVIEGKHVLLNRAPTLHRQGIQAFRPILIEGNAVRVHPLVCPAFNADFDGDQMAVHVPLSPEAQLEAKEIISANKNILKPGLGAPVIATNHDIALGSYWMTKIVAGEKGEGKYFCSPNEAITAYDFGVVAFRAKIKVLPTDSPKYTEFNNEPFETSVGRLLFNTVLPSDYEYINREMKKQDLGKLVDDLIVRYGLSAMPPVLDRIKDFGFTYAMRSGVTWSVTDLTVPTEKEGIIKEAQEKQKTIIDQYREGLLSVDERKRLSIEVWHKAKSDIEKHIPKTLDPNGSVHDLVVSGARGSMGQITQMAGMRGLMLNTRGETIEFPVIASMKEGLTPIEYFITTHGARKGLSDTALNTAKAGYLTRRLFDVAQDVVIAENDCGTKEGIVIGRISASGIEQPFSKSLTGRILAEPINASSEKFSRGHLLSRADAVKIEDTDVESITVRSPSSCKSALGVCQMCYGADHSTQELVDLGEAVGTVAAQAIGEPGTQLTMRTFHTGGVSSVGGDITTGLPRVEEVFERRPPKNPAIVSKTNGVVTEIKEVEGTRERIITVTGDAGEKKKILEYSVYFPRMTIVKAGDTVKRGDMLTDGSANIEELFNFGGKECAQEYIIHETSRIYELQGAAISRKHVEVIIKQMFGRRRIKDAGDTGLGVGDLVEEWDFLDKNRQAKADGNTPATGETVVLGIQEASLARKSFLSAASFQHTTKILINASVRGAVDPLRGLKENVILGRLIPAGTGFSGSQKYKTIKELQNTMLQRAMSARREVEAADIIPRTDRGRGGHT
jgi:DNA-directed RNA polymerase subunit beta'